MVGPLAIGLCGVGVECSEGVGLLGGEGGQVVDVRRQSIHIAVASERHVVASLGLEQHAQAPLRIRGGEHGHRSVAIDVGIEPVVGGVVGLPGILGQHIEVAGLEVGS